MLMKVRTGERQMSGKAAWRLRNVELQAGLASEPLREFIEPGTEDQFGKKDLIFGPPIQIMNDAPRKTEIGRLSEIADKLAEQLFELRKAIAELEK